MPHLLYFTSTSDDDALAKTSTAKLSDISLHGSALMQGKRRAG